MTDQAPDTRIGRRAVLGGFAGAPLAGGVLGSLAFPVQAETGSESLDAAARNTGRRFGSAVAWSPPNADRGSFANPAYARILKEECSLLVAENEMKWGALRPGPGQFRFDRFDALVNFATENGKIMRGHTLLWHRPRWMPKWVNEHDFGSTPVKAAESMVREHIETVTRRYRGRISSYDVVNEVVDHDTGELIDTSISKALGGIEPTLDLAFHTARAELPNGELVYNDYMSWEGNEKHRSGVLRLLEGFRKRNVPVDALGIQSHIEQYRLDPKTGIGQYDEKGWKSFIDDVVGMGYQLIITEFDVKDHALPSDIAKRDAGVAAYAKAYLDFMFSYPQLRDVLAWGMVDKYSWLQGFSPRDDKLPLRCCPYDDSFHVKQLREAIAKSFRAASVRPSST